MARKVFICTVGDFENIACKKAAQSVANGIIKFKGLSQEEVCFFVSPNIILPDINNKVTVNMFLFSAFMANRIDKPTNMQWKVDLYKYQGFTFEVFDVQHD